MRTASFPMYSFGAVAAANRALWAFLSERLRDRGIDVNDVQFDAHRKAVPDAIGPEIFLTQVCGYPLFKMFRGQARMLATPCYGWPGCAGATHRAFFIVRADDNADDLDALRGRVFGCNSRLSNSGMNLPRLTLARRGAASPFFSSVVMTGGHRDSVQALLQGGIDVCSVDCVTWGLFNEVESELTRRCRVLDQTVASPSLPFVTSASTSDAAAAVLVSVLHEVVRDPATLQIRNTLGLTGFAAPDVGAYEQLESFEREAAALGYPEID